MNGNAAIILQVFVESIHEHRKAIDRGWDLAIYNRIGEECQSNLFAEGRFLFEIQFVDFLIG